MIFDILCSFKWFAGFAGCIAIQLIFEKYIFFKKSKAQIITCILFQVYFVTNVGLLIFYEFFNLRSKFELRISTLNNMYILYGYFIYDTIYMLEESPDKMFLAHHLISLIIINTIKQLGIKETWHHSVLCFILEVTNPFINIRQLIKRFELLKIINKRIIFITYLLFRIILLPLVFISFLIKSRLDNNYPITIIISFICIYTASILWFKKIILMQNFKNV